MIFDSRLWVVLAPALCILAFLSEYKCLRRKISCLNAKVLGILQAATPKNDTQKDLALGLAEVSFTMPANIIATIMISIRILLVSRQVNRYADQSWERQFTSVAAILIESAVPGTAFWIIAMIIQIVSYSPKVNTAWDPAIVKVWQLVIVSIPKDYM
jgi:hypothetical protein